MHEIDRFIEYLAAERGYSPRTMKSYRESLVKFSDYLKQTDQELNWNTIDADVVRNFMASEMEHGLLACSVNCELSALRSFYKYLLRMKLVEKNPMRLIHGPKAHKPLPSFLKESEVTRLFDDVEYPDTFDGLRDRTILLTFYHTGIRLSELVGLNVADVNLSSGELKVTGKRNKQRVVPFGEELRQALKHYIDQRKEQLADGVDAGCLFCNNKKERMGKSMVRIIVVHYL